MYVCPVFCLCIAFPFTPTLGGGDAKVYLITVEPNLACSLGLLGIIGFTILLLLLRIGIIP